jgi:hypothetical protein
MQKIFAAFMVVLLSWAATQSVAAPIQLKLSFSGPNGSVEVDGVSTSIASGVSFLLTVDTTTLDTFSATDYGQFIAS